MLIRLRLIMQGEIQVLGFLIVEDPLADDRIQRLENDENDDTGIDNQAPP